MERIYLAYSRKITKKGMVTVKVFLKDVSQEHIDALKSFLRLQRIHVIEFDEKMRKNAPELSYFDDGFVITFEASRWSYFKIRRYIHSYLDSWHTDTSFCCHYLEEYQQKGEFSEFDDHFFCELGKMVDACEDKYYINHRSIALFINCILHIFRETLHLYWASARLQDVAKPTLSYLNYTPPNLPKEKIVTHIDNEPDGAPPLLHFPVVFNNEHIADFHLQLGAYSPPETVVRKFVDFVLMHIDDFIYGDLLSRRDRFQTKLQINKLQAKCTEQPLSQKIPHMQPADKSDIRILLLGNTRLSGYVNFCL